MDAIMITGWQGFTGRYITQRLVASGRRIISYNRNFAADESGVHTVQGELFDVPRLVRLFKEHKIGQIVHTAHGERVLSIQTESGQLWNGPKRSH